MIARMLPVMPLFGGKTKFQPVYVGDVAEAFAQAAAGQAQGRARSTSWAGPRC